MRDIAKGYYPDYPVDLATPAGIAGVAMEEARLDRRAFPTIAGLARDYTSGMKVDLLRVQRVEECNSIAEAKEWIFTFVFRRLAGSDSTHPRVIEADGAWRFADGVAFDDLRWNGKKLSRMRPPARFEKLQNFFNPMVTPDAEVRKNSKGSLNANLDELRDSLKERGWDPLLGAPIVKDNRGITLAGRRRERLVKELNIELPLGAVIQLDDLSDSDADNFKRWTLMAMSNSGTRLTSKERQAMLDLLTDRDGNLPDGVSQENLAAALGVVQSQISKDLNAIGAFGIIPKNNSDNETPPKPKRGRPRKNSGEPPKVAAYKDPNLIRLVHDLWARLGYMPTGKEMVAECVRTGTTTLYNNTYKVPSENTCLRTLNLIENSGQAPVSTSEEESEEPVEQPGNIQPSCRSESEPDVDTEAVEPVPEPVMRACPTCSGTGRVPV